MLAQEAPGATGLARSTRRATWIRLQDYGGKNPARLHRAPRARRRPRTARLWLRVNKPARRLGVRRSEGRGGFTQSCPPPPPLPLSLPCSLPESNTSPAGFMSISSGSGFLNQLPSGRRENVVLPRWEVQTACVREAPAAAAFPWQPACFHSVTTPFGSVTPVQLFQPESAAPSFFFFLMRYDAGGRSRCRQGGEKEKKKLLKKKYSTIWWRPLLSHLSE